MAVFKRDGASIAASTTDRDYLPRSVSQTPYQRTIQGIALVVRDNTPAYGDLTYVLKVGQNVIHEGTGILANSAGAEVRIPEDVEPVNVIVPPMVPITLEVTNTDAAAAHTGGIVLVADVI